MSCNINVTLKSSVKALQSITEEVSLASALPSGVQGFDFTCQLWAPGKVWPLQMVVVQCGAAARSAWVKGVASATWGMPSVAPCCVRGWLWQLRNACGIVRVLRTHPAPRSPARSWKDKSWSPWSKSNTGLWEKGGRRSFFLFSSLLLQGKVLFLGGGRITSKGMGML